jgi:hypothetical protein
MAFVPVEPVAPVIRTTGVFVVGFISLTPRLAPLHWLLLYCYRRLTVAFGYHEADALSLLADASEKTGLAKACCEFHELSQLLVSVPVGGFDRSFSARARTSSGRCISGLISDRNSFSFGAAIAPARERAGHDVACPPFRPQTTSIGQGQDREYSRPAPP